jgi:hypothetical protein
MMEECVSGHGHERRDDGRPCHRSDQARVPLSTADEPVRKSIGL